MLNLLWNSTVCDVFFSEQLRSKWWSQWRSNVVDLWSSCGPGVL